MGIALTVGIAAMAGIIVALTLPRGPTTQTQGLLVLASGLIVGLIAGYAMRSGWALLLAPLVHVVALEIARPQLFGPATPFVRSFTESCARDRSPSTVGPDRGRIAFQ